MKTFTQILEENGVELGDNEVKFNGSDCEECKSKEFTFHSCKGIGVTLQNEYARPVLTLAKALDEYLSQL